MNTESEVFQLAVTLVNDHGEDAPIYTASARKRCSTKTIRSDARSGSASET